MADNNDNDAGVTAVVATTNGGTSEVVEHQGKKGKYRRPKPWDTVEDHWVVDPWTEDDSKKMSPFLEESSFATLFPKYREQYLKANWSHIVRALKDVGIDCTLDLIEGSMTVRTTRKTRDPYILLKARDMIKLLARSVAFAHAVRILEDGMACDIVKIGGLVRNKERLVKRRMRLIGPNGSTLKAIELLTGCYVMVQGNTVSTMGPHAGLKQARTIILDCMNNIHPIYNIKALMIKRELAKDPELKEESWDRFLPKFRKQNVASKKPKKSKKKEYTPFPPEQTPRKIDLQMQSGEYFLTESDRAAAKLEIAQAKRAEKARERADDRNRAFIAPAEKPMERKSNTQDASSIDVSAIKARLKARSSAATTGTGVKSINTGMGNDAARDVSDFVVGGSSDIDFNDKKKRSCDDDNNDTLKKKKKKTSQTN